SNTAARALYAYMAQTPPRTTLRPRSARLARARRGRQPANRAIRMPTPAPKPIPSLREALGYSLRLFRLMQPYRIALARGVLLGLAVGMIGMATPYISTLLTDRVYPSADVGFMHVLVGAIAGISVGSAVLGAIRGYYTQVVSSRMNAA